MSRDSARRSTSSKDVQGSSYDRRARKLWLVREFPADVSILRVEAVDGHWVTFRPSSPESLAFFLGRLERGIHPFDWMSGRPYELIEACRCYRCGCLLSADEVSPDRWPILGADGGTYRRGNIRPACVPCNVRTGSAVGHSRRAARGAACQEGKPYG